MTWEPTTRPWIVCAACKLKNGLIITGARHWDSIMRATMDALYPNEEDKKRAYQDHDPDWQGFIDQFGRYYNREEARQLAEQNGQLIKGHSTGDWLYSEDLY